jgi:hypothetical protein
VKIIISLKSSFMKKFLILFLVLAAGLWVKAQSNVYFLRSIGKNGCGDKSDECYSYAYGSKPTYSLKEDAKSRLNCSQAKLDYAMATGVKYFVILSSSFSYPDSKCTGTVYSFGAGNNRDEAVKNALSGLSANNWSWKESYGYKVQVEKSL